MLTAVNIEPSLSEPNWFISEKEKFANADYWMSAVSYFSSFYNQPLHQWNQDNPNENLNPVERGLQYCQYYIGKQTNINYNHVSGDATGNTLQPLWVKSKKVKHLVDRLAGQFIDQLFSKEINAMALSKRAKTTKEKKGKEIMFKYDNRFQQIRDTLAEMGIVYQPLGGQKFKDMEDAERWLTFSYKDSLELYAADLGKGIEWMNDSNTMYIQSFINDLCPANYMGIYNYVANGQIKQKRIPFYNLVYDITSDDPFVRDGRFAG